MPNLVRFTHRDALRQGVMRTSLLSLLLSVAPISGTTADDLSLEVMERAEQAITMEHPLLPQYSLEFIKLVERRCEGYSPFTKTMGCFTEVSAFVIESARIVEIIDAKGECHNNIHYELGFVVYLSDDGDSIVSKGNGVMHRRCKKGGG